MITIPEEYVRFYKISTDEYSEDELFQYIQDWEPFYLRCLMGDSLYNAFRNDLTPTDAEQSQLPQEQRFLDLLNGGVTYTNRRDELVIYDGIKNMLKGFVYGRFVPDSWNTQTVVGKTKANRDASSVIRADQISIEAEKRSNRSVDMYNAAYNYILENVDLFPEYQNNTKAIRKTFYFAGI